MIPPCDPSILDGNPQFKRLHENLTTNLLNPDSSTRVHSADPARKAAVEDLKQCQSRCAKRKIKERTLRKLAFAVDSELPDECRDILALISLYLETPRSAIDPETARDTQEPRAQDDSLSLLTPEIETFYSHLPALIHPFSNILSDAIAELRAISSTTASPRQDTEPAQSSSRNAHAHARSASNHHARARARDRRVRTSLNPVPPLASQLRDRIEGLRRVQLVELPAARRQMAATAAAVLAVKTQVLEQTVVILERVKHGTLARATKAKAEHLATLAQGVEGKLEVTKLEIAATLYTPETITALGRYQQHLHQTRGRLQERRELAIDDLKSYGDVEVDSAGTDRSGPDGGTLAEIARRYGALADEVETVRMEIARLGE